MLVLEILVLGALSAFWPSLLLIVILAIRGPQPARILVAFLAGGLITCVTIGMVVVELLRGTSLVTRDRQTTDPVVYIVAGILAIVAGYAVSRYRASGRRRERAHDEPGRSARLAERMIERGALIAFVGGVVLNIVPGLLPIVAIKDIAELDASSSATFALALVYYVLMFGFIELPLIGYVLAPESTTDRVVRFNVWLRANAGRLSVSALLGLGALLIVRGGVAGL